MVKVRKVLVATYGRAIRKLNVARKHLPHDKLVLVCDRDALELPDIKENVEERGGEFVHVMVDPYDFEECLRVCYDTLEMLSNREVSVNVSCGPKTLVGAMIFAAFHAGVEVYHCDVDRTRDEEVVIRLPTLMDFELRRRFSDEDWGIVRLLGRDRRRGYVSQRTGLGEMALDKALGRLERDGILRQELRKAHWWICPTAVGRFFSSFAKGKG